MVAHQTRREPVNLTILKIVYSFYSKYRDRARTQHHDEGIKPLRTGGDRRKIDTDGGDIDIGGDDGNNNGGGGSTDYGGGIGNDFSGGGVIDFGGGGGGNDNSGGD